MNEKSKNLRYPSLGEFTFIDERPGIFSRPSFHSDPIPHNYESDMDSGLTKSIDTGNLHFWLLSKFIFFDYFLDPIFEQYEMTTWYIATSKYRRILIG